MRARLCNLFKRILVPTSHASVPRPELFYSQEELEGWRLLFELNKAELRVGCPWCKDLFLFVVHPAKPRI